MTNEQLLSKRQEIENIDKEIITLFERRMEVAKSIALFKKENNLPVFDKSREEQLLVKNSSQVKEELRQYYLGVFSEMLKVSKQYQEEIIKKS